MNLNLYYHTLRHLKPVQLYGRAWFRLHRPKPDFRPAPLLRKRCGGWQAFPTRSGKMLSPFRFCFLNVEHDVDKPRDWNHPEREKIWLYNLHYFDDLLRHDKQNWVDSHTALIRRWIAENPVGQGNGWEPYPLSLRIVNWIKWPMLPAFAHDNLAQQARYLRRRLEMHLLGNHLFANAKALIFAGAFFMGDEAEEWLEKGIRILWYEIKEQILADGAHFELSPMYHSIILEDVLDLIHLTQVYPALLPAAFIDDLRVVEYRMRCWLVAMTHPDGEIAFFNDAAMSIAAPPAKLHDYARRLAGNVVDTINDGVTALSFSGYIRLQRGPVTLLFDAACIGPDYLPGHAHADTLSFELSWNKHRVLCNSGTSCYGTGAQRRWERGTSAHNTVSIGGHDSSEVWSGFRVGRRAYTNNVESDTRVDGLFASAGHDGYRRLPGKPVHWREVCVGDSTVKWTDRVSSVKAYAVIGRLPLHPSIKLQMVEPHRWLLFLPDGMTLELCRENRMPLEIEDGWYASEFGNLQQRSVLIWRSSDALNLEEKFIIKLRKP